MTTDKLSKTPRRRQATERAVMIYLTRNFSQPYGLRYTTAIQWHCRHGIIGQHFTDVEVFNALRRLQRRGVIDSWTDESRGWYRRRVWYVIRPNDDDVSQ